MAILWNLFGLGWTAEVGEGLVERLVDGPALLLADLGAVDRVSATGADLGIFAVSHGASKVAGVVKFGFSLPVNGQKETPYQSSGALT
jgi:hypothetical protein